MPGWQSLSFAWGPLITFGVLVALVWLLRWAFGRGGSLVRPESRLGAPDEYGLLVPVAAPRTYDDAEAVRVALQAAGIRSTLTRTTAGLRVLVWPETADQARGVVRRLQQSS